MAAGSSPLTHNDEQWDAYVARHPPKDDDAFEEWREAGRKLTNSSARALAVMSGGQVRILRLGATLSTTRMEAGWTMSDLGDFDQRGQAIAADWAKIALRRVN